MRIRITDDILRSQSRPLKGQTFLWDDLVDGFGARLTPHAIAFVIKSKNRNRKTFACPSERGAAHGWKTLSAVDARKEAQRLLMESEVPAEASETLARAMSRWADSKEGKPRYVEKVQRIAAVWIAGAPLQRGQKSAAEEAAIQHIGRKPVGLVTRADALRLFDALKAAGRKTIAGEVWAIASVFYGWAMEREMAASNPFRNRLRVMGGRVVRKRKLSDPEIIALARAFKLETYPAWDAFRLALYTGARRREVANARWAEFDLKAASWVIPAGRTKNGVEHKIALAPSVVRMLKDLPHIAGNDHLFVGIRDGRAFDFHHALIDRVRARVPEINDWRLHDLRRAMRSGLGRLGVSQMVAELMLNHQVVRSGIIGVYDQHDYQEEMKAGWRRWAVHVDKLIRQ